jgi:membrane protein required for colicin V production
VTRAVNWYDVVVFVALLYGVWSGLRAGLTGEIIRVIGLVLMVLLAVELYQPAGDWIQNHSQLTDETAHLLSFVSIAVVVYLLSVAARLATHRRMQQLKLGGLVENVGGAFAGVIRVAVIMAWVTVVLSLTNSEFLRQNVSRESRFGSFVVAQLPALQSAVQKTMPQKMWLLQDLKRPPEPNYEETGATDTNTNRPQVVTP